MNKKFFAQLKNLVRLKCLVWRNFVQKIIVIIILGFLLMTLMSGCIDVSLATTVEEKKWIEVEFVQTTENQVEVGVAATEKPSPTVQPTSTVPVATQTSVSIPTTQTTQFIGTITIPSDTNAGITYTAPQSGIYIFQYSDPPTAFWNGIQWATEVVVFQGPIPQWVDKFTLNYNFAIFTIGELGFSTKQEALDSTISERRIFEMRAGDVITFIVGDDKTMYDDNTGEIFLDVYTLSSQIIPSLTPTPSELPVSCEILTIPFTSGINAATSERSYQGLINIISTGYGKAGGEWVTDSFYLFIDEFGNNISPRIPNQYNEYILHINNQPAFTFIPGQAIPEYRNDHVYSFTINAPGGRLVLGVNDKFLVDNTGGYEVTICIP